MIYMQIANAVGMGDLVPQPPHGTPSAVAALVSACCQYNPADRPSFNEIVDEVEHAWQIAQMGAAKDANRPAAVPDFKTMSLPAASISRPSQR